MAEDDRGEIEGRIRLPKALVCKITLGPLTIDTEASVEEVGALILMLVREYRELPRIER